MLATTSASDFTRAALPTLPSRSSEESVSTIKPDTQAEAIQDNQKTKGDDSVTAEDSSHGSTGISWDVYWQKELKVAEASIPMTEAFCWETRYSQGSSMFRDEAKSISRSADGLIQGLEAMGEYSREDLLADWTDESIEHLKLGVLLEFSVYGQILTRAQRSHEEPRPQISVDEKTGKLATYLLASEKGTLVYDPDDHSADSFGARGTRIDLMFPSDQQSRRLHESKLKEMEMSSTPAE